MRSKLQTDNEEQAIYLAYRIQQMLEKPELEQRDVSERIRDEKGRFLPYESPIQEASPSRSIRVVRKRGTYGTYDVLDADAWIRTVGAICVVGLFAVICIIAF